MEVLPSGQQINQGQQLESVNGRFNLIMQPDGNLVLYRTRYGRPLWASSTDGTNAAYVIMQTDGNLVIYTAAGEYRWDSSTDNNPGAYLTMQDDGNLVVYSGDNNPLWASNTVQDLNSPTFGYSDGEYSYVEVSESWKDLCRNFPCFAALQWPGYASKVVEDIDGEPIIIDGQRVVVQLWKGWCQKFLGLQNFPGGVGAEVGVYRRMPERLRPTSLPFLPAPLEEIVLNALRNVPDDAIWWPDPNLRTDLEFTFVNSLTGLTFLDAGPERSYWLTKWMNEFDYAKYIWNSGIGNAYVHPLTVNYWLDYKINGRSFPRW